MSTLITIAYPSEATAKAALAELQSLQKQSLISIDDAVIAHHQGDKIKLDQVNNLTKIGASGGALWGGLFGLLFLVPVAGIVIGAATGALSGKLADYGIDDSFAKDMQAKLGPGKSALVLLVRQATTDRVLSAMKEAGLQGEIIQTNLSEADEAKLREAAASA